jgi:hypothetical protein
MLDDALRETAALEAAGEFDPWKPRGPFLVRRRWLRPSDQPSPQGDFEVVGEAGEWLCDTTEGGAQLILAALASGPGDADA